MYKNVKNEKVLIPEFIENVCPSCTCYGNLCSKQTNEHVLSCPKFFNYKLVGSPRYNEWMFKK